MASSIPIPRDYPAPLTESGRDAMEWALLIAQVALAWAVIVLAGLAILWAVESRSARRGWSVTTVRDEPTPARGSSQDHRDAPAEGR